MMRKASLMALAAICIAGICSYGALGLESAKGSNPEVDETKLNIMQIQLNSSSSDGIKEDLKIHWNNYVENLNHTSDVMHAFMLGNLSREESFILASSIIEVNSRSIPPMESMEPDEKYAKFHTYTLEGLRFLNDYLWGMAKYFQTGDGIYVLRAAKDFNRTLEYYELGKEEAEFVF